MNRKECLEEAMRIVCQDRDTQYGKPENNFKHISELWTIILKDKLKDNMEISAVEVALMMIELKMARIINGKYKADNYVDLCGYAACASEIHSEEDKWEKELKQVSEQFSIQMRKL